MTHKPWGHSCLWPFNYLINYSPEQLLLLVKGHHTLYEMLQLRIHPLKLCTTAAILAVHFQTKHSVYVETSDNPLTTDLCCETTFEKL